MNETLKILKQLFMKEFANELTAKEVKDKSLEIKQLLLDEGFEMTQTNDYMVDLSKYVPGEVDVSVTIYETELTISIHYQDLNNNKDMEITKSH